jgi:hypothetical protein
MSSVHLRLSLEMIPEGCMWALASRPHTPVDNPNPVLVHVVNASITKWVFGGKAPYGLAVTLAKPGSGIDPRPHLQAELELRECVTHL